MNERTRLFVAMGLAAVFLFGFEPAVHVVEHATGWKLWPAPATQPTTEPSSTMQSTTLPSFASTQPGSSLIAGTQPSAGGLSIPVSTTRPADVLIGSAERNSKQYSLQMRISPVGGGVSDVVLNQFTDRVGSDDPFQFEKPINDDVLAMSTTGVKINGQAPLMTGRLWNVEQTNDHTARVSLDLNDAAGKPVLTLVKTYEVLPIADEGGDNGPRGYDTKFTYSFINRTGAPISVSSALNGPVFPPSDQARGGDRNVIAGYRGKNAVILRHDTLESFSTADPKDYTTYENEPLLWIGAGGNYFNGIVRPTGTPWIKAASAKSANPEVPEAHLRQVAIDIETNDVVVPANGTATLDARVFFGPRKREVLKNPYYSAAGLEYQHTLEVGGSSCAFCTFSWLVDFLMVLLGFFQMILQDWGLAIIALVFVVRACLHPITKRAQINMAKMGKMGPEIERIKKKYGDDKEAVNRAMMEFYKNQGATPILGCLPMFLQMPIWIALYSGLSSTFELRQAKFLYGLTWIKDLSKPDHLLTFSQPVNFFFLHLDGLNILPLLLAVAYFLQQKYTPKPMATTPEQQQQQKMMQWMTLLFPVMLYSSPSGLNLYILTSTIFGVIESRIIRRHLKEREALEAAGPTFVDGEIVERPSNSVMKRKVEEPKAGGLIGWFQKLQAQAEQIRNDAEKKARDKRK